MSIESVDRRALGPIFRERLTELIARAGLSKSAFAARVGIDRTALSQLLSDREDRLPRAETLAAIARATETSLDWLLGLSLDDTMATEVAAELAIETGARAADDSRLIEWRREAQGAKIRYAPALLPDLLRLPEVAEHELGGAEPERLAARREADQITLELSRTPEADMEIVAPRQRMEALAQGHGVYADLPAALRTAQLAHIAALSAELYPSLRLFLYDERRTYSAPFTVFGVKRVAIYLGDMYLVLNARAHIQALTRRFDELVRAAEISDREAPTFLGELRDAER